MAHSRGVLQNILHIRANIDAELGVHCSMSLWRKSPATGNAKLASRVKRNGSDREWMVRKRVHSQKKFQNKYGMRMWYTVYSYYYCCHTHAAQEIESICVSVFSHFRCYYCVPFVAKRKMNVLLLFSSRAFVANSM